MIERSQRLTAFLRMMKRGDDFERRGFELLLQRENFSEYFDFLSEEGLFDESRNPQPVEGDKPGYFRVPLWPALPYLEAVAKRAGQDDDPNLAGKVLRVLRKVTTQSSRKELEINDTTWASFTKILGLLPVSAVSIADIDLLRFWLRGRFDRLIVPHAVATGALKSFVNSNDKADWLKACRILFHCTELEARSEEGQTETGKLRTVSDDFSLKEIINAYASDLGAKVGLETSKIFEARLIEAFSTPDRIHHSYVYRPAVENHEQNYDWRGPENRFVEGLRDVLSAWLKVDERESAKFVSGMFGSKQPILERIAIFIVNENFDLLRKQTKSVLRVKHFDADHLHELYVFLDRHFDALTHSEKATVTSAIEKIKVPKRAPQPLLAKMYTQKRWLQAIGGKGWPPADEMLAEINKNPNLSASIPQPAFSTFHQSGWGSGPTPYQLEELTLFAGMGTIVERLNAFSPPNTWDGPSVRSLADTLEEAVVTTPNTFLAQAPAFYDAKVPYVNAYIGGFKRLWRDEKSDATGVDWQVAWTTLVEFFEGLLIEDRIDLLETETDSAFMTATLDWIYSNICDFLRSGSSNDAKLSPDALIERVQNLILTLLRRCRPSEKAPTIDALNQAINTTKGKAIEALFSHTLRICRKADREKGNHDGEWLGLECVFEFELQNCRDGNFEYSALAGAYLGNLEYMSHAWVKQNIAAIFPGEYLRNLMCAFDGLAFTPATKPIYMLLLDGDVINLLLRTEETKKSRARERLVERLCLAYLWDIEQLESPRMGYLFDEDRIDDLTVCARFFWTVRGELTTEAPKSKVLAFWHRCVAWSANTSIDPEELLSALAMLSTFVDSIGPSELSLLLATAPYLSRSHNVDLFLQELVRLVVVSPEGVVQTLSAVLNHYRPPYDFNDRLKLLIETLASREETRVEAIRCLDLLISIPGMLALHERLVPRNA